MQGIAALAGVILTAVGVFGLVNARPAATPTTSTTNPTDTAPLAPVVTLESVTTSPTEVRGLGSFLALDPASDAILLVGQPQDDPSAVWLPVLASTLPATTAPDGRQNGRWEAGRPNTAPDARYTWYAVVAPKAAGAGDGLADLRARGPHSSLVLAASQAIVTGG